MPTTPALPNPVSTRTGDWPTPPLRPGDHLTQDEFLRRWAAMPSLRRAELIGGVVHMPSALSVSHSRPDALISLVLGVYAAQTPGVEALANPTVLLGEHVPQPDQVLRILPAAGGQTRVEPKLDLLAGPPELCVEVSVSSVARDVGDKLQAYAGAGGRELLVLVVRQRQAFWHALSRSGTFELLSADEAGVLRSRAFPGLWLDVPALWAGDAAGLLHTAQRGVASVEHQAFVDQLRAAMSAP